MKIHARENERPQNHRQDGGSDPAQSPQVREVVMVRCDDDADDHIDDEEHSPKTPEHASKYVPAKSAAKTLQHGLEGIVAKRLDGRYQPGRRGWIKIKHRSYWRFDEECEAVRRSFERPQRRRAGTRAIV